ncbi:VC0807 family protein [Intrasporangium sp. YIM S08009]|uniref:VC0807 family protein n=1 Tax=Intrasporangium zincisolvens TaxID=3080018 RepID=UPI002B05B86D|nr:VC0807 family protein [Intrasporangium sp. YIM S08009]
MIRGLAWDVGLPLAAYYLLHLVGASDWMALLAGTLAAGARILWVAARDRTWNLFATVILVSFLVGLGLAFVSGDPRFLLLKDSVLTGTIGICFLVSTAVGRPLTLAAAQSWGEGPGGSLVAGYDTDPLVRRGHRICSLAWGFGLLAEALIKGSLVFLLPVTVMVGLSTVITVTAVSLLVGFTLGYIRHVRQRAAGGHTQANGASRSA